VSATARRQLERLDEVMAQTLARANETVAALQKSLMIPIRQLRGVAAAAAAVLDTLVARRRATVDRATLDEEMFI
jgi:hypothetical protein